MRVQEEVVSKRAIVARKITLSRRGPPHLFWYAPAELPAHACLHGKSDVVHLELARASRMLGIHERVRENLRGIPMRELEQLVQDARLRILDGRRRRQEERDGSRRGRERIRRGAGHGCLLHKHLGFRTFDRGMM